MFRFGVESLTDLDMARSASLAFTLTFAELFPGTLSYVGELTVAVFVTGRWVVTVAVMGVGNGVIFQIVSEWFPRDIGLASGLVGAAGGIGGFLVPIGFGFLRESTGTFLFGFVALAVVSIAAAMTVVPALRWRSQAIAQVTTPGGFSR